MNKVNLTWIAFCCVSIAYAQQRPVFLLEDMDEHSLDVKCYCKPGVRNKFRTKGVELSYQFLGNGVISAPNDEFVQPYPEYSKFRKFRAKLSLPLIRRDQFKIIVAYKYDAEQFELKNTNNDYQGLVQATDGVNFKSSTFDLSLAFSPN